MLQQHRRYGGGDELLLVGTFRYESAGGGADGGGGKQKLYNTSSAHSSTPTPFTTSRTEPNLPSKTVHQTSQPSLTVKVNFTPGHEGPEVEKWYSSTLSLTSALDGVCGQSHAPAALPAGK